MAVAFSGVAVPLRLSPSSSSQPSDSTLDKPLLLSGLSETATQPESKLSKLGASLLKLLDSQLLPSATSGESTVFYLKMKGDYYRYLAEFMGGDDRKKAAEDSMLALAAQVRFQFDLANFSFNSGNYLVVRGNLVSC